MYIVVVQRGDTLWQIANRYGTTVARIVADNMIPNPNQLVVGQTLVIPGTPGQYTVRPGDTLWAIAQQYGTTVEVLVRENGIANPSMLRVGQVLRIPLQTIESNGYLTRMGEEGARIVNYTGPRLTYIASFSYHILADGNLTPLPDEAVLAAQRPLGVSPLMCITNFAGPRFSSDLAHTILASTQLQETLLDNIESIMNSKRYYGLNIDFEYVYPADRELYNQFLARAADRMRAGGYQISSAVAPKIRADQPGLLYPAHDYPMHGRLLDFVVLMTYEWGWAGGPPMAIAPLDAVRRVLDYAVTTMPRNKIMMGMPTYGRDWTLPYVAGTSLAATISPQEAIARAARNGVDIRYDPVGQSPFYRYVDAAGRTHEVWFEDARSVQAKFNTVRQYGLRGISYWEISSPFPQNWLVLDETFRIRKR